MKAKAKNTSCRMLFLSGGRLDILFQETDRQIEGEAGSSAACIGQLLYCPCGCGLEDNVCAAQQEKVKRENDEIPF